MYMCAHTCTMYVQGVHVPSRAHTEGTLNMYLKYYVQIMCSSHVLLTTWIHYIILINLYSSFYMYMYVIYTYSTRTHDIHILYIYIYICMYIHEAQHKVMAVCKLINTGVT
jgi:hypothetical protein